MSENSTDRSSLRIRFLPSLFWGNRRTKRSGTSNANPSISNKGFSFSQANSNCKLLHILWLKIAPGLNLKRKSDGDSHRVVDVDGAAFYIPAGWLALEWQRKTGEAYSF